jgi:ABC-type xylose transport system permease subunit
MCQSLIIRHAFSAWNLYHAKNWGNASGAFIMGVMNNGMSIMGIGIDWQQVIKGAVLMFAVLLDVYYKNKAA